MDYLRLFYLFFVILSFAFHGRCKVSEHVRNRRAPSPALPKVNTTERLRQLREKMRAEGVQAYIIPSVDQHMSEYVADHFQRRPYVSGFTGSAGDAVVTMDKAGMWTDGRYFNQAGMQMDDNWTLMKDGMPGTPSQAEWLAKELKANDKVGVDANLFSIDRFETMHKELAKSNITLTAVTENLVDEIWTEGRPPLSNATIFVLEMRYTGKSWEGLVIFWIFCVMALQVSIPSDPGAELEAGDDSAEELNLHLGKSHSDPLVSRSHRTTATGHSVDLVPTKPMAPRPSGQRPAPRAPRSGYVRSRGSSGLTPVIEKDESLESVEEHENGLTLRELSQRFQEKKRVREKFHGPALSWSNSANSGVDMDDLDFLFDDAPDIWQRGVTV